MDKKKLTKLARENLLYFAWFQALIATLGSLYFSEIAHFKPCILCWYQRIFMYPLVFILGVGIIKKDKNIYYYILPLVGIGLTIAFYHLLVYYSIVPHELTPCDPTGVSCGQRYINWFGFVTIPLLSFVAFVNILVSTLVHKRLNLKK